MYQDELKGNFWDLPDVVDEAIYRADLDGASICEPRHIEVALGVFQRLEEHESRPARFLRGQAKDVLRWWTRLREEDPNTFERLREAEGGLVEGVLGHFVYKEAHESFADSYAELQELLGCDSFSSGGSRPRRILETDPFEDGGE